ncbi:MAG: flagella basal body P-ring formation protein FlgA [Terriglobales bacterium]
MKKLTIAVSIFALAVAVLQVAAAQESPQPYSPVSMTEAWQAVASDLRARGFGEEQLPRLEDIELPLAVPARAGRNLHVSLECWDRDSERARFRIECREAGACLPFLAYLRQDSRGAALVEALSPSCRAESRGRSPSSSSSFSSSSSAPRAQPSIRAGEHAIAVLRETGFRMSASVTCLDRGAQGDVIRVRSEEGHIFRARVAGPALVEALPE